MEVNSAPQNTEAPLHIRDHDSTTRIIPPKVSSILSLRGFIFVCSVQCCNLNSCQERYNETFKEEPDCEEHYSSTGSRSSMYTCSVPPLSDKVLFRTDISFRPVCF